MKHFLSFICLITLAACAGSKSNTDIEPVRGNLCISNLASHGEKVILLREMRLLNKCRSMGLVTSPRCHGAGQGDYHINGLKNAAGQLGADHVLILPDQATKEQVKGQAFLCVIPKLVPLPESETIP